MFTLEWAYLGRDYVRCVVPIATSGRHSAWGISWGEAQRQSIYADPKYDDGYYSFADPPSTGLGAARMAALLTYRSRNSFESRFGRNAPDPSKRQTIRDMRQPSTPSEAHFQIHNDGHKIKKTGLPPPAERRGRRRRRRRRHRVDVGPAVPRPGEGEPHGRRGDADVHVLLGPVVSALPGRQVRQALRQQLLHRHDAEAGHARRVAQPGRHRGRGAAMIEQPTLVLGIESDGLFTFAEQEELAEHIPNARLGRIRQPRGPRRLPAPVRAGQPLHPGLPPGGAAGHHGQGRRRRRRRELGG